MGIVSGGTYINLADVVESLVMWYYRSTSVTERVGGSWSISKPAYVENTYLWTKNVTTYVDGSTTETTPILDPDWHKVQAIADKFGVTTDGALIQAVMMLLREFNSLQETAGVSGIQGALKNNPAFWAGGTYAKAFALIEFLSKMSAGTTPSSGEYSNLAKIILLHNGAGKYGDLIIEESGRVVMVNPLTGERRLVFSVNNIPDAYELIDANTGSGSANNTLHTIVYPADEYTLPNTINVTKEGSSISVNANLTLSWDRSGLNTSGYTTFNLILCRNGVDYLYMDNSAKVGSISGGGSDSDFVTVNQTINDCPSGIYSLRITLYKVTSGDEPRDIEGTISASTLQWSFSQSGIRSLEFGRDGFFALWEDMMFHVSQNNGFVLTGKTNMPGVLASGSVSYTGVQTNVWGAKSSSAGAATITGGRSVPLSNLTHNNYTVIITPHTATTFRVGTKTTTSFQALGTGGFDYVVIGKNY